MKTICGSLETDAHQFFHYDFACAVWFSTAPPLRANLLPNEDDGVLVILPLIIFDNIDDPLMERFLTTLWYIWKTRNDKRFRRKS
jgi:hypothetical protein